MSNATTITVTNSPNTISVNQANNVITITRSDTVIKLTAVVSGGGDVVGPLSSIDNELALFDGVTGQRIKGASGFTVVSGSLTGGASTNIRLSDGTDGAPAYSFASDIDSGISSGGANIINFTIGGTPQWSLNASGNWVDLVGGNLVDGVDVSAVAVGPGSSLDNELALFDGVTGKLLQGGSGFSVPSTGHLFRNGGGTAALPVYAMSADGGANISGVFMSTVNRISFSVNGDLRGFLLNSGSFTVQGGASSQGRFLSGTGTAGEASHTFRSDPDTGMSSGGADILRFTTGGVEQWDLNATGDWVDLVGGNLVDGVDVSETVVGPGSAIDEELALFDGTTGKLVKGGSGFTVPSSSHLVTTATGTASLPVFALSTGQANPAGMYSSSPNNLSFAVNGNLQFRISSGGTFVGVAGTTFRWGNGAASDPTYSFFSDSNTGMLSGGADVLDFATGGVEQWSLNATGDWVDLVGLNLVDGRDISVDGATLDTHVADLTNPHVVTLTQAYAVSASGGPHIDLDATRGPLHIDGASLASGLETYFEVTRGATTIVDFQFETVADRTIIRSGGTGGVDFQAILGSGETIIRLLENQMAFLPTDRTLTGVVAGGLLGLGSTLTLDFVNATLGSFVLFNPTIMYAQNANAAGMGLMLNGAGTFQNDPTTSSNLSTGLTYVGQNLYRSDTNAITMFQLLDFMSQPRFDGVNGGALTVTADINHFIARGSFITGATLSGDRICFHADDWTVSTGTLNGANVGLDIEDLTAGAGTAIGIRSLINGTAFIQHDGTAPTELGGNLGFSAGAGAVDVVLSRGAANRLDLASGDSFRIVSGALEHVAGTVGWYGTTPQTQDVDIVALTDSTGGAANNTLVAITGSGDDANINNNFADLTAKFNALRDHLRRDGRMA